MHEVARKPATGFIGAHDPADLPPGKDAVMLVNHVQIRVEFGDCDPANIVYFAKYFYWFDRCTSALFRAAGLPLDELMKSDGVLIPVVDVRAQYNTSSSYGDELVVESSVTEWKKSSFVIRHKFLRDGVLVVEGWETHVWATAHPTEPRKLKSVPLPTDVIQKLSTKRKCVGTNDGKVSAQDPTV